MRSQKAQRPRPLSYSLARLSSAVAVATVVQLAISASNKAATAAWDGTAGDFIWTHATNWATDTLPTPIDDLLFGSGQAGTVHLGDNQTASSAAFTANFALGDYGTNLALNDVSGNITVAPGVFATINASLTGNAGINISGGGSVFLTNPLSPYSGGINVDGAGTTLVYRGDGPAPQYNGVGSVQLFGRSDYQTLGFNPTTKTITLSNGGEFKMVAIGNNPEANHKNISIGLGGGTIDVAAGYVQYNLDDVGQVANFSGATLTKSGLGRLTIGGALADANPLAGDVIVAGGVMEFNRIQGAVTTAGTRFSGMTGTSGTTLGTNILTVNSGGILLLNNGTAGTLDVATVILNNGAALAIAGGSPEYGLRTGGDILQINGEATFAHRDFFNPQTSRNAFINSDITGSGVLNILPGTNAGGASRVVVQRSTAASTFNGTFRLLENANLELNPRDNTPIDIGKVLANADVEFKGWGGQLDVRDSDPAAANVKDYSQNDLLFTSSQAGNLNTISVNRATTATGTGHEYDFGTLSIGNHRFGVIGANSFILGFGNTAQVLGNAQFELRSAPVVFNNALAILENQAGQSFKFTKTGLPNAAAQDVTCAGLINVSNLILDTGTLDLRGTAGGIGKGFGGAPATITLNGGDFLANTRGNPSESILHLDSGGTVLGVNAGNNNNRIDDADTLVMRGLSEVRLTSAANTQTTETIGTINAVGGHATFNLLRTGIAPAPVTLTLNALNLTNSATVNFLGVGLGAAGNDSSRIVLVGQADSAILPARYHQGNEWASYSSALDSGVPLGVQTFTNYTLNTAENTWAAGQNIKLNTGTGVALTANRTIDTLNAQITATNQAINVNGFVLTLAQGGLLDSVNTIGITDANTLSPGSGITAGTSGPSQLIVHNVSQIDIKVPIRDNLGPDGAIGGGDDGVVDFVKDGIGTVRLTHQSLGIGTGNQGGSVPPFTTPTWTSTMTGSWIINDGTLEVHRGQFLNSRPIILNGGTLNINEPGSSNALLTNWHNNVIVNGNAVLGTDDNGESADAGVGTNTIVLLGNLTINNGAILGLGAFSGDTAFIGTHVFNNKPTINLAIGRTSSNNDVHILSGAVTGSGFDVVTYGTNPNALILGGTSIDTAPNTFTGTATIFGGQVRLNKANGVNAIPDTLATEDLIINGGSIAWGAGHHGDLVTTNNPNLTNNGIIGLAPTSPAGALAAGMNQIDDNATVTLLAGTLGEADRFNNEKWNVLIQKNGTLNVGLGTMEVVTANVTGGTFVIDRGGTFKVGTLNLNPGAYSPGITTGLATPGAVTTLDVGALNMSGQSITLGTGSSGNLAGSGAVLRLRGNVSVTSDPLNGNSYNAGIYVQNANSFREIGSSRVDLNAGTRDFSITPDVLFYITAPLTNGGISKSGGGGLILQPYTPSTFAGPVVVNSGTLSARADGAFGTSAGGITIANGATVKLESSWTVGDDITVTGPGATVPGESNMREIGALISDSGTNRLTGALSLGGAATIASNFVIDPSVAPAVGGYPAKISNFRIEGTGGITGTGTLTLSGHGDGIVFNGIKTTTGGLVKDGAGRWILGAAGTYVGPTTIEAGALRITNGAALGATASGTTVLGGTLELAGGITTAEPLTLFGAGQNTRSGAVLNVSGDNALSATVTLGSATTLRSDSGTLMLSGAPASVVSVGGDFPLTLSGAGAGVVRGNLSFGVAPLTKNGTGTWTLAGNSFFVGETRINGGTLTLDYSTNNGAKLASDQALVFGGGSLNLIGSATAPTTQFVTDVFFNAGAAKINVTSPGTQNATLNLNNINHTPGGTVDFTLPAHGGITSSVIPTNGIIGGYATIGGTDWAAINPANNTLVALNSYQPLVSASPRDINFFLIPDTNNSIVTGDQTQTGSVITNSLKITGGAGLNNSGNDINLTAGGVLYTGTGLGGVFGTGLLAGLDPNSELVLNAASGVLDLSAPLIGPGGGSLTKTGAGTVILRGNSAFTGAVNVDGGTLSIVGPGGTTHPTALGSAAGPRNLNINGGTFQVVGGDYDSGATNMFYVIGEAGGTIRSVFGANVVINDGPGQFSGSGDLTYTGGGRYTMTAGAPNFPGFGGAVTVDGGILSVGNNNATTSAVLGGRPEQTITLKPGSALINNVGTGLGSAGLPNNLIVQGGVDLYSLNGNRAFEGNVQFSGTNNLILVERDNVHIDRQMFFNGRVSGTNVTLNVFGANFGQPVYFAGGSNDLTGTINLNTNAVLETRTPGSLGINAGDVTINLNGANSRLFLRSYQNGDYHANVVVNNNAELNSDRLVNYAGGTSQLLTINDLTVNGANRLLTINGGNSYTTRIAGSAKFTGGDIVVNALNANALFENGINFTNGGGLDKRGNSSLILRGPSTQTGTTLIQGGFIVLEGANGALPNTSSVELRGGELRLDGVEGAASNRINDAANVILGGGVLRILGPETFGNVSAVAGNTQIVSNLTSETSTFPLTLNGFTRALGATVQFQAPDSGMTAVGASTLGSPRASSRIIIPGQANVSGTTVIPGFLGNNNLDFVQYDGTTIDNGVALGVRDMRNPGTLFAPATYSDNTAETGWNDNLILHSTTANATVTLTANRALEAWKAEAVTTLTMNGSNVRIENGGILAVGNALTINSTTGTLTAGPATPGTNTAELFIGGNNTMNINAIIADNGTQPVALVKTGTTTLNLGGTSASTYTGGTYINSGTLNVTVNNALGLASNPINLAGGTLQLNVPTTSVGIFLGGFGHAVNVNASSLIIADNGNLAGTDNDYGFGSLSINGPYTLGIRGFDSEDVQFTGTHTFAGTPTIDLPQAGSGSNPNTAGAQTFVTINGPISGSGFNVSSSGATDNTAARLQIGGGESIPNTYVGKVTLQSGSFNEDMFVELNKAPNTLAITGDVQMDGGHLVWNADNQVATTSNILLNWGYLNLNGKNQTLASLKQNGGLFRTNGANTTPANVVTITGDYEVTGVDDFGAVATDGVAINSQSTLVVNGIFKLNGYSKATIGGTNSTLIVGGLEMTGTTLTQNAGTNLIRLNGDVTTFPSVAVARLGNSTTATTVTELNGTRIFNIADGPAGLDMSFSSAAQDSTSPVAAGGITKIGGGVMQLEGSGAINAYSGPTTVNEGTLILFKTVGINALGSGVASNTLTIGDGLGGARADKVIIRNNDQIADTTPVTIASSGLLDLQTFAKNETVGSIAGSGAIDLGPGSILTDNGLVDAVFSGPITGPGSLVKNGVGNLELSGVNDIAAGTTINDSGRVTISGRLGGNVTVNGTATLAGSGIIDGAVNMNAGTTLSPGNSGPGRLTVNGPVSLTSGATYSLELNGSAPGTGYDQLVVGPTGNILVSDAVFAFTLGFAPGFQNFVVINNQGSTPISGFFNNLAEGQHVTASFNNAVYTFTATYVGGDGNDLVLAVPEPTVGFSLLAGIGLLAGTRRRRRSTIG